MPADVRAGQVIALVEMTGGLGSPIDVADLAEEFGFNIATLLPIIDTGEMLGLVKVVKGKISLTDLGLRFQKLSKHKIEMLKDQLCQIEPFKTTLDLSSKKKGGVSAQDVAEALQERDIRWHHTQEQNESLIQELLIHWAIYAGILTYNGKTGKFQKFLS